MQLELLVDLPQRPQIKTPQELIHIKHSISLVQYKLWIILLAAYREFHEKTGRVITDEVYCRIPISTIREKFDYRVAASVVREDLEALRSEPYLFNFLRKDGKQVWGGVGFISGWLYEDGVVSFKLPHEIRLAIERLDSHRAMFLALRWTVFSSFVGKYEGLLYKLCADYVGVGQTPVIPLETFREYMGLEPGEYADFKRLSQWVISNPTKKVNACDLSEIVIKYDYTRQNRRITGVKFYVESKIKDDVDPIEHQIFSLAKVPIPPAQQKSYLETWTPEQIAQSLHRANEYAESEEAKGHQVQNLGAVYRRAIEDDWGTERKERIELASATEAALASRANEKAEATARAKEDELRRTYLLERTNSTIKSLTPQQRKDAAMQYCEFVGGFEKAGYNPEESKFLAKFSENKFIVWLRVTFAQKEIDETAFAEWKKARRR